LEPAIRDFTEKIRASEGTIMIYHDADIGRSVLVALHVTTYVTPSDPATYCRSPWRWRAAVFLAARTTLPPEASMGAQGFNAGLHKRPCNPPDRTSNTCQRSYCLARRRWQRQA